MHPERNWSKDEFAILAGRGPSRTDKPTVPFFPTAEHPFRAPLAEATAEAGAPAASVLEDESVFLGRANVFC